MLKNKILAILLAAARLRVLQPLVSFFYRFMIDHLPVELIIENDHWMACHHPQPDYPVHILILPKQKLTSILDAPGDHPGLFTALFGLVQQLIKDLELKDCAYRLVTNGGQNQAIPIWHWHLVSDLPGGSHD